MVPRRKEFNGLIKFKNRRKKRRKDCWQKRKKKRRNMKNLGKNWKIKRLQFPI